MNTVTIENLNDMIEAIKADYKQFMFNLTSDNDDKNYRDEAIVKFNESIRVDVGRTYFKIVKDGSVHSFVVKQDGKKFKAGDILFPASWKAPATNFARGNVLTGNLKCVSWSCAM